MRLSIPSLYAAHIAAKEAERCDLLNADGHVCSPLCQWIPHLRGRLKIEYTNDPNASAMLRPTLFDALTLSWDLDLGSLWRSLEAIELVLLAARLDPLHTWENVIRVQCQAGDYYPSLIKPVEIEPRLRLVLGSEEALIKCLRWLRKPWLRSPSYWLTRKWQLYVHHKAGRSPEQPMPKIPVLIELDFKLTRRRLSKSMTRQVCKLATRDKAKQVGLQLIEITNHDHEFRAYRLANPKLWGHERYRINDVYNCSFAEGELLRLHNAGIRMRFSATKPWNDYSKVCLLRGDYANPIDVLKFRGSLRVAWSLLREAGGVKEVHLKLYGAPQLMRYDHRAVAAALLDPRSPTSVEHVYLRGSIKNESFNNMLRVLQADDPFEQLRWGQLTASQYRPTSRSHLRSLSLELHPRFKQDNAPFFELLRIIGFRLESLSLEFYSGSVRLDENDLGMLFSACPKLQCLSLCNVSLASLDPIVNACNVGLCPSLTSIIHDGHLDDEDSVANLFEACNDPQQQVHRMLRDLEFTRRIKYSESILHRVFEAIRRNQTLRHIGLYLKGGVYSDEIRGELQRISLTAVLVHSNNLPVRLALKHAFLSAVRSRLDQDVRRRVLEFTGGAEPRRIVCEVGPKPLDW